MKQSTTISSGAVSRIVGVRVPTLNMWISRGLIPRMIETGYGADRPFDVNDTLFIAVTVELVRLGYSAAFGAMAAAAARDGGLDQKGAKLVVSAPRKAAYSTILSTTPSITHLVAETPERLDEALDGFADGRPAAFVVVELDRLAERVRRAFNEPDLAERARRQRGRGRG